MYELIVACLQIKFLCMKLLQTFTVILNTGKCSFLFLVFFSAPCLALQELKRFLLNLNLSINL